MQQGIYHVPVLLHEVLEGLQIDPSGVYVDCTFGGGGHSKAILEKLNTNGRLIAFDQDEEAWKNLPADERMLFIAHNFRHLQKFLRLHKIREVNGILADLGVSSHQFDKAGRGFSTRFNADMDMRMDRRQTLQAMDIIQKYPTEKLHRIFEIYGEVTNAKTLAQTISARRATPLKTIDDLKNAVYPVVKGNPNKYFAQVFQALRIEVNDELGALKDMLQQAEAVLGKEGRIAVITFHSLEDRIVKHFFKGEAEADDIYGTRHKSGLRIITKKPIVPGEKEIKVNPRARSAKLRIAEKI